jgi:hypothetical protein
VMIASGMPDPGAAIVQALGLFLTMLFWSPLIQPFAGFALLACGVWILVTKSHQKLLLPCIGFAISTAITFGFGYYYIFHCAPYCF